MINNDNNNNDNSGLVSLPPRVRGRVYGYLHLTVDYLIWDDPDFSANELLSGPLIRVQWWGDVGRGTLFHPHIITESASQFDTNTPNFNTVRFPICSMKKNFIQYMEDTKNLKFQIFDANGKEMLGQSILDLQRLVRNQLNIECDELIDIKSLSGVNMGSLHVKINVVFDHDNSSNIMIDSNINEHVRNQEDINNNIIINNNNTNNEIQQLIAQGEKLRKAMEEEIGNNISSSTTQTSSLSKLNNIKNNLIADPMDLDKKLFDDLFLGRTQDITKASAVRPMKDNNDYNNMNNNLLLQQEKQSTLPSYVTELNAIPPALTYDPMIAIFMKLRSAKLKSPAGHRRKRNIYLSYRFFSDLPRQYTPVFWLRNSPIIENSDTIQRVYSNTLVKYLNQSSLIIEVWDRDRSPNENELNSDMNSKRNNSRLAKKKKTPFRNHIGLSSPSRMNKAKRKIYKKKQMNAVKEDSDILVGLVKIPYDSINKSILKLFQSPSGWTSDPLNISDIHKYISVNGDFDIMNPFTGEKVGILNAILAVGRPHHMITLSQLEISANNAQRLTRGFLARRLYQRQRQTSTKKNKRNKGSRYSDKRLGKSGRNFASPSSLAHRKNVIPLVAGNQSNYESLPKSPIRMNRQGQKAIHNIKKRLNDINVTSPTRDNNSATDKLGSFFSRVAIPNQLCTFLIVIDEAWLPEPPPHEFTLRGPSNGGIWFKETDDSYYLQYTFFGSDQLIQSKPQPRQDNIVSIEMNGRKVRACKILLNHQYQMQRKNEESLRDFLLNEVLHVQLWAKSIGQDRLVGSVHIPLDGLVEFDASSISNMATIGGVFALDDTTRASHQRSSLLNKTMDGKIRIRIQVQISESIPTGLSTFSNSNNNSNINHLNALNKTEIPKVWASNTNRKALSPFRSPERGPSIINSVYTSSPNRHVFKNTTTTNNDRPISPNPRDFQVTTTSTTNRNNNIKNKNNSKSSLSNYNDASNRKPYGLSSSNSFDEKHQYSIQLNIFRACNIQLDVLESAEVSSWYCTFDMDEAMSNARNSNTGSTNVVQGEVPKLNFKTDIPINIEENNIKILHEANVFVTLFKCNRNNMNQHSYSYIKPSSNDIIIGTATINLSPLICGFETLSGWYHLMNDDTSVGQIMISIKPNQALLDVSKNLQYEHTTVSQDLNYIETANNNNNNYYSNNNLDKYNSNNNTNTTTTNNNNNSFNSSIKQINVNSALNDAILKLESMRLDLHNRLSKISADTPPKYNDHTSNRNSNAKIGVLDESLNKILEQSKARRKIIFDVSDSEESMTTNDKKNDTDYNHDKEKPSVRIRANPLVTISPVKLGTSFQSKQNNSNLFDTNRRSYNIIQSNHKNKQAILVPWADDDKLNKVQNNLSNRTTNLPIPWSIINDEKNSVTTNLLFESFKAPSNIEISSLKRARKTTVENDFSNDNEERKSRRKYLKPKYLSPDRPSKLRKQHQSYDDYFTGDRSSTLYQSEMGKSSPMKRPRTPPPPKIELSFKLNETNEIHQKRLKYSDDDVERLKRISDIMKRTSHL